EADSLKLEDEYNKNRAPGMPDFSHLTPAQRAVLGDVVHHYHDLAEKTPHFWKEVTEGRWDDAAKELREWSEKHPKGQERYSHDASLLEREKAVDPESAGSAIHVEDGRAASSADKAEHTSERA